MAEGSAASSPGFWLPSSQSLQTQQEMHRRYGELWNDYAAAVSAVAREVYDRAAEAYSTYVSDLAAAWASPDMKQACADTYQHYVAALRQFRSEGEQKTADAFHELAQSGADSEARAKAAEACRTTIHDVWLDPERTKPVTAAWNAYEESVRQWLAGSAERLTEASRNYAAALTGIAGTGEAASDARAAFQRYVEGVHALLSRSTEEER
jgi:hypothetical protein